ncbi:transmembrane protein 229B-like [Schistocerca americana]|uniref:transmembrane protein 229B-like n=1 Tax=Schistocerca americana TaxID=7009 RepID=UPI001F4FE41B|nr:transmembrane protein 229B-like [Schistocerca americana]
MQQQQLQLSPCMRLYIYGLHGFLTEIIFTAAWEYVTQLNWKLPGCSSVWSLPIYGISGLVMESILTACMSFKVPIHIRGLCYLLWVYLWEFSTGSILKTFGACPWDYSEFTYNFRGLITFEYAPLWYVVSLLMEKIIINKVLQLRWVVPHIHNGSATKLCD